MIPYCCYCTRVTLKNRGRFSFYWRQRFILFLFGKEKDGVDHDFEYWGKLHVVVNPPTCSLHCTCARGACFGESRLHQRVYTTAIFHSGYCITCCLWCCVDTTILSSPISIVLTSTLTLVVSTPRSLVFTWSYIAVCLGTIRAPHRSQSQRWILHMHQKEDHSKNHGTMIVLKLLHAQ